MRIKLALMSNSKKIKMVGHNHHCRHLTPARNPASLKGQTHPWLATGSVVAPNLQSERKRLGRRGRNTSGPLLVSPFFQSDSFKVSLGCSDERAFLLFPFFLFILAFASMHQLPKLLCGLTKVLLHPYYT